MTVFELLKNKLKHGHGRQIVMFGGVGLFATFTDLLLYLALISFGLSAVLANIVAFPFANAQGYVLNALLTFRVDGKRSPLSWRGYGKFLGSYLISFLVATLIIWALAGPIGVIWAKLVATGVSAVMNYLMGAFFIFRPVVKDDEGNPTEST